MGIIMNFYETTFYGLLSYCFVYISSILTTNIFHVSLKFYYIYMPIWIIFWALVFGIICIRTLNDNEIYHGFIVGLYFAVLSIILDILYILFIHYIDISTYLTRISYFYIFYPIIMTGLGYLANFEVQLK